MKSPCFILTGLVLFGVWPESYTTSGTIIAVVHTQHKAVVATDSRLTLDHELIEKDFYADNGCKIAVLGDSIIFAAAGYRGEYKTKVPRERRFDVYEEARKVVAVLNGNPEFVNSTEKVANIASRWGNQVAERFQGAAPWALDDWLEGMFKNVFVEGIFVGVESSGNVAVAIAVITYQGPSSATVAKSVVEAHEAVGALHIDVRGKGEIADEFIFQKTKRAQLEYEQWELWGKQDPRNVVSKIAIRLVELTTAHHPSKEVGGPIDAIVLTPANGIHWIRRKPSCPTQ